MPTANEININDKNKKVNLLNYLKAIKPIFRSAAVKELNEKKKLKNFELEPVQLKLFLSLFATNERFSPFENLIPIFANPKLIQFKLKPAELKAILSMFAIADRFNALKLLKITFDIRIHLTPFDIKTLEACLAKNDDFNKLLPLNKKKVWDSFFVKDGAQPHSQPISHEIVTIGANKQKNPRCIMPPSTRQREKGIWSREIGATREAGNTLHSKFIVRSDLKSLDKFASDSKHNAIPLKPTSFLNKRAEIFKLRDSFNSNNSLQKKDIKKISVELLSIKIMQYQPRGRIDFFKNYVKAQKQVIFFENAEEFYKFIKVFPTHDAIKLLDLPYIKDQIKNLQQQGSYLSVKDYIDLLNYIDEKLLKPISPKVNPSISYEVPDLISSCKRK